MTGPLRRRDDRPRRPPGRLERAVRAGLGLARRVRDRRAGGTGPTEPPPVGDLDHEVLAHFADGPENLYQLRQWLGPLEHLHARHPVLILTRDAETFAVLARETTLPIFNVTRVGTLDALCLRGRAKMAVYVNQNPANFQLLRYPTMLHVSLFHGESEKRLYMATNQAKAYDFTFVAGEAAVARYRSALLNFDVEARLRRIGRPQLDTPDGSAPPAAPGRTTVLYAPTWEGDRPSVAYGSVESHGRRIVEAFTAGSGHRLIFRPHPRTGLHRPTAAAELAVLCELVERAARRDPAAGHRVDTSPHLGPQLAAADILICDISAVAYDFLPTGKPIALTVPVAMQALVAPGGAMEAMYRLDVNDLGDVAGLVEGWVREDLAAPERESWVHHHFGDTSPGASLGRFVAACEEVIDLRDAAVAAQRASGGQPSTAPGA